MRLTTGQWSPKQASIGAETKINKEAGISAETKINRRKILDGSPNMYGQLIFHEGTENNPGWLKAWSLQQKLLGHWIAVYRGKKQDSPT